MQTNQDALQNLQKCTVSIYRSDGDDGKVLGTGVIATNDGIIITCYHVVGDTKNKTLDEIVGIQFPLIHEIKAHAKPICGDSDLDVAVLKLQEIELPKETDVANLDKIVYLNGHGFQSFGFRKPSEFNGLHSDGKIMGPVNKKIKYE